MIELSLFFLIGYVLITLEHKIRIEKSAVALVLGGISWLLISLQGTLGEGFEHSLLEHLTEISTIVFFLLAAMTIVEVIESYHGFRLVTGHISLKSKRSLLWFLSFTTFFLSAILDNLATTLVMLAVVHSLLQGKEDRLFFSGMIVIAANAGGAFSPIGDITTTMLWIGGQITFPAITWALFLPSLVNLLVPLIWISFFIKGPLEPQPLDQDNPQLPLRVRILVFSVGVGFLISVPILKTLFHIPPYLSLLTGLGILWILTEILGSGKVRYVDQRLTLPSALRKIDLPSILFFIGILLAVSALQVAGVLAALSLWLTQTIGSPHLINLCLGLFSAVFDNVPLVAGAGKMFSLAQFPQDSPFWHLLAYTAGTGGSILIIGSAAGITAMGVAKMTFGWYARKMALPALVGFFAGAGVFILGSARY